MTSFSEWWMWVGFFSLIIFMIFLDLYVLGGKKAHRVSVKEAVTWSIVWFTLALIFNFAIWIYLKHTSGIVIANQKSFEFLTGYLIEKSLSIDNIFVIMMIFQFLKIPEEFQREVLIFGILGAIVMRLILILFGIYIVNRFQWVLYIFGLFLIYAGIKMFILADNTYDLKKNPVLIWLRKHLRITEELHGENFFIIQNKILYFTPLFITLILIESTDFIFAIDSIPAIFSITNDPFIVFTSNIFAILGLRALYFLLIHVHSRFHLLKYGLAVILIFVGLKMLINHWYKIPVYIALGGILAILSLSIILSLYTSKGRKA